MKDNTQEINLLYDFGVVGVNKVAQKKVLVENSSSREKIFEIHCDSLTNPLDHVFDVEPYAFTVQSGDSFHVKLKYSPKIPSVINFDHFSVFDPNNLAFKFSTKGMCAGPRVECRNCSMLFLSTSVEKVVHRFVTLENNSSLSAKFSIGCDDKKGVFSVDCACGVIRPHGSICLKITFRPLHTGVYARDLFCLFHYQEPIRLEVVGICSDTRLSREEITLIRHPQILKFSSYFESYINDCASKTRQIPLISLSSTCIDFSFVDLKQDKCSSQVVSVTNHTCDDVKVEWDKDSDNIFTIKPLFSHILPGESSMFEVLFCPTNTNFVYGHHFICQVYWKNFTSDNAINAKQEFYVPITLALNVMGHTAEPEVSLPRPLFEVHPKTVIMPPCIPPFPVYGTLLIKCCGSEPVMFKFVPPKTTNYTVKPMQGILFMRHQVVVIELFPNSCESMAYIETWGLKFNDNSENEISIDFKGYAGRPTLEIGWDNTIAFPDTYPGCETSVSVPVRNLSRHSVRFLYNKLDISNNLVIPDMPMVILPNQILHQMWYFTPKTVDTEVFHIACLYQFEDCQNTDKLFPVSTVVLACGRGSDLKLISEPPELNLGIIKEEENNTSVFSISNSGRCDAHIALNCVVTSEITKLKSSVTLSPQILTIPENEMRQVSVSVSCTEQGKHELYVKFDILKSEQSDIVVSNHLQTLTTIRYEIIFPKIQICDLDIGTGGLFSKVTMWEMLQIDKWNQIFARSVSDDMSAVNMNILNKVVGSESLTVSIVLKNVSSLPAGWKLKRYQECDCPLVTKNHGLSLVERKYDCPHRAMFTLVPSSCILQPGEFQVINMTVSYNMPGTFTFTYVMELNDKQRIKISATMSVISENELSVTSKEKHLKNVYIGSTNPLADYVWLYNSTPNSLSYEMESITERQEVDLCDKKLLQCLNPKGTIKPNTVWPLFFQYKPLQIGLYKASATMRLGSKKEIINLKCEGVEDVFDVCEKMKADLPAISGTNQVLHEHVSFSRPFIVLGPVGTHERYHSIIFISNNTSDTVYKYEWSRFEVENVCCVTVKPHQGVLQPLQNSALTVIFESYSTSCYITAEICCTLYNLTDHQRYRKIVACQKERNERKSKEFKITEKGITYPSINTKLLKPVLPSQKSVPVLCYICDRSSLEFTTSMKEQSRLPPKKIFNILQENSNKSDLPEDMANFIMDYMSKVIWDILTSQWPSYKNTLYYEQIVGDKVKDSYWTPSHYVTASILNNTITQVLLERITGVLDDKPDKLDICSGVLKIKREDVLTSLNTNCVDIRRKTPKTRYRIVIPNGLL